MLARGAFQFQTGAIKSQCGKRVRRHTRSFNSRLVRLKVDEIVADAVENKFQFQTGAIKRIPETTNVFYWSLMVRVKSFFIPLIFQVALPSIGGHANSPRRLTALDFPKTLGSGQHNYPVLDPFTENTRV